MILVEHLEKKGWKILDLGVKKDSAPNDTDLMFHRVGLRVGAEISEGNYERALLFCGTGMGIHIAVSKCPHVHAGVVESLPAATRAITDNGVNVLAMGAFYVAPKRLAILPTLTFPTSLARGGSGGITSTNSTSLQLMNLKHLIMMNIRKMALR